MQIGNPAIQLPCQVPADTFYFQPFWMRDHCLGLLTGANMSFTVLAQSPSIVFPAWIPAYCCPFNQQSFNVPVSIDDAMVMCKIIFHPFGDVEIRSPSGWEIGQHFQMDSQFLACLQLHQL